MLTEESFVLSGFSGLDGLYASSCSAASFSLFDLPNRALSRSILLL